MSRTSIKRAAIIEAAIHHFKESGFESTSMDQIAATAEVSKRTVYNHFASKEALFEAIIERLMTLFSTSVSVNYDPNVSLEDQLSQIARQEMNLLASSAFTDLARVCLAESLLRPELIDKAITEAQTGDGDLKSWLKAAHEDGRLAVDDLEFVSTQFFCFGQSVLFLASNDPGQAVSR